MDRAESLRHSRWECRYHVVFIPKERRKTLYLRLARQLHHGGRVGGRPYAGLSAPRIG